MSLLYILDSNLLSDVWFETIFFHFIGCLFILLIVAFAARKLFSFMQSCLFTFAFVTYALGVISKKGTAKIDIKKRFPCVSFSEFYGFRSYVLSLQSI